MATLDDSNVARLEAKRDFADFLDSDYGRDTGEGKYVKKIEDMMKKYPTTKTIRLDVDVQDLSEYNPDLHRRVLESPGDCIPPFAEALEDMIRNQSPKFLSKLVSLQGIVTRCTLVRPKVVKSVHWCAATNSFTSREYRDASSIEGLPTSTVYPTRDEQGNLLSTQYGMSSFVDHQTVTIQELPETAPPGQLPRSVEVVLEDDLRDACKPGDRVRIVGVYKPIAPSTAGASSAVFRAIVMANSVSRLAADATSPTFSGEDYDNIVSLSQDPGLMECLAGSLAPSIYGYSWVKRALLLLLVGGRERVLGNGTHLRGDINCLLVGDPGVAKSQLLRAVMNLAPLSVSTTGRGSSGVGLTAAVTTDADTGERRLEAGAMVLADRGVVCIDEFDKMNDADRVAIHEVMEQQTVTIAKAGIMTSLNARCSVVAAANPIYGHYDRSISITRNIGLPDSLLSRFDLLFVVLDNNDAARDRQARRIAEHVLGQHRYRAPGDDGRNGGDDRYVENLEEDEDRERGITPMYVRYDARLYGPRQPGKREPLSIPFLKKYVAFAKQRFAAPELTPEASDAIAEYYADLRTSPEVKALPVTVRTLETLIRLSCAHAKVRLSAYVEPRDVTEVIAIMDLILKSDPSAQEAHKTARTKAGGAKRTRDAVISDEEEEGGAEGAAGAAEPMDVQEDEAISDAEDAPAGPSRSGAATAPPVAEEIRELASAVRAAVLELGQRSAEACNVTGVLALLRAQGDASVSGAQVRAELEALEAAGAIMLSNDEFYLTH
ncbi:DNA replication licensing factor MCM3-like protein 3 [Auxenochlorella protothecoides]|uniref:DNA replication licensing factor MCM3 n=1 Tax=Auxenochlorella protothecoides TaxID=3075 RepID=A0A087SH70_AUXPR|nr:DNA replication licensing factor MCM3-like protein 3 [Auxenochlorella protothecoides]KFM25074.1 DNA replication licensing factor MCM3-like protein 3 [Auxenochlorella protothecoides]